MTAERWRQIESLYHSALERPRAERDAFVAGACNGDKELQREVESLLASHETAGDLFEEPVAGVAAQLLSNQQNDSLIGREISHYKVLSLLGRGGMGEVYLAEDVKLSRKVALKLFHPELVDNRETRERFMREARLASLLDHPNICTVYEVSEAEGRPFIAVRYVRGKTLKQLIAGQPLALESLFSISLQAADALATAHAHGIIHRDIKAENIMVGSDGRVQILDFGIAKLLEKEKQDTRLTMTGLLMGTPAVMSPEQACGENVDARSDIFSFGLVIYEMTTGRLPFAARSQAEIISALLKEPHTPAAKVNTKIPPRLSAVIDRALEKEPDRRYQSMEEMITALQQAKGEAEVGSAYWPGATLLLHRFNKRVAAATLLVLIAAAAVLYYFWSQHTASSTIKSIAVLPFKPLTSDSRDESLEMGMADTLITKLSNLKQLVVRPMSAVRRYSRPEQDAIAAGREQKVDAVLEGNMQKSGERIRVTARLVSVTDGHQLWTDKFDEQFTDIFSIEDSVSERVAEALTPTLSGQEKQQLTKHYTDNAEAYRLYLKGRFDGALYTPEAFNSAVKHFQKAIAIDPNYALAYDGLAYCYYATNWWAPVRESETRAMAFAKKALEIDDTLAEAHTSLGILHTWAEYDWPAAEKEFKRALELNPNYASAHLWHGFLLLVLRQFDKSIAEVRRATELDPISPEANSALGSCLFYARRYGEALRSLRTTIGMYPDYWFAHLYFARALEQKGDLQKGIEELENTKSIEGAPAEVWSALGYAYAVSGRKDDAQKIIVELRERSRQTYVAPYSFAVVYAGLDEKDQAFALLEKERAEGAYYLTYLNVDPELDSLRSDPRFNELVRRMNLER